MAKARSGLAVLALAALASCAEPAPFQARFAVRGRWRGEREIAYEIEARGGALEAGAFRRALERALSEWAATGCARFREAGRDEGVELAFAWARTEHGECAPFGVDPSVAHAGPVGPGTFVHFDAEREWDEESLRRAALHEIGHVLGLDHSPDESSVMFPEPSPQRGRLAESDLAGIWSLYGGGRSAAGDLVVVGAEGEVVRTLHGVAPEGITRWAVRDVDGDGDGEVVVWRTDEAGFGGRWVFHFGAGVVLERVVGPRFGGEEVGGGEDGDLDGDGVVEGVRRRGRGGRLVGGPLEGRDR